VKVLVTSRVQSYLSGTGVYQKVQWDDSEGLQQEDPASVTLMQKVHTAPVTRKDRAVTVELSREEAVCLREYAESLEMIGRDNSWDADGRADLNAGAALLRKLDGLLA
jgi:hypothetical protein